MGTLHVIHHRGACYNQGGQSHGCALYAQGSPVKSAAYTTMVHPILEYSSTVWDPHHNKDINNLEQVQRRAARFVNHNYTEGTTGCVTNMIQSLGWESLHHRCYINRFTMLFKIQHDIIYISPDFVHVAKRPKNQRIQVFTPAPGHKRRIQFLHLSSDH